MFFPKIFISTKVTSFCIKIVKTGPSFADAAMGRIAQGTKVLAEGGYEKGPSFRFYL